MAKKTKSWEKVTTIQSFKNAETVRVFGIARVSTDKQAKKVGESLDHQKEVLENWVKSKSSLHKPQYWNLVELFVENEDSDGKRTGRTATIRQGRLGLKKALELARLGIIDVVVVTKLDRIARNLEDYIHISAEFNESKVALVCLDLDIDTSTPDGQMIMRNHANLAQWQAERIAQYSIETVYRHLNQGRPIGSPPLGYRIAKDSLGTTTFEIDTKYKKHVQFMDRYYGRYASITRVVDELFKKGYRSPKEKVYTKPFVSRVLRNLRYVGKQEYDGKIYEGNWEPIRSDETHNKNQQIMAKNRKSNHGINGLNKNYVYMAAGILKCGKCFSAMVAKPGTGRGKVYHPYYVCNNAEKSHGHSCDMTYLPAREIDERLIDILKNLRMDPKIVESIVTRANTEAVQRLESLEADLKRIRATLKDIKVQNSKLIDAIAQMDGLDVIQKVNERMKELNIQEKELELEERKLISEIKGEKEKAGDVLEQVNTLKLFDEIYKMNKQNPERIKALLPRFINYVVVHFEGKAIKELEVSFFNKPFDRGNDSNENVWNRMLNELREKLEEVKNSVSVELNEFRKYFFDHLVRIGLRRGPHFLSFLFLIVCGYLFLKVRIFCKLSINVLTLRRFSVSLCV